MTYTQHGHHIPGSIKMGEPIQVARCGGPGLCSPCSVEAWAFRNQHIKGGSPMDNQLKARTLVAQYFNRNAEKTDHAEITVDDTYVVWWCFILGGWKALVSTTVVDGMYYEVTYNKEKRETYLDAYKKWENIKIEDGVIKDGWVPTQ